MRRFLVIFVSAVAITVIGAPAAFAADPPAGPPPPAQLDKFLNGRHQAFAASFRAPRLTTKGPNELILAFVSADGPAAPTQAVTGVTGGGLTWTLAGRSNGAFGTAEVWEAFATKRLQNVSIGVDLAAGAFEGLISVGAFTGAAPSLGAVALGNGATGRTSVPITTTKPNSLVWSVGHDWTRAITRRPGPGRVLTSEFVDTASGDTSWTSRSAAPIANPGTTTLVSDNSPTTDRWDVTAVEITPAGATPGFGADKIRTGEATTGVAALTSPAVSTTSGGQLVLALVAADGPVFGTQSITGVTGGGLTFTRLAQANLSPGVAEIWQAFAPGPLTGATFTATLQVGNEDGAITITTFTGAAASAGASAGAAGTNALPRVQLTTTAAGSEIWAVGRNFVHSANVVIPPAGQPLANLFRDDRLRDTFWVQHTGRFGPAGRVARITDSLQDGDRWDLAAAEVRPAPASPPPPLP